MHDNEPGPLSFEKCRCDMLTCFFHYLHKGKSSRSKCLILACGCVTEQNMVVMNQNVFTINCKGIINFLLYRVGLEK